MRVGQARKRDANEPEIVDTLVVHGFLVQRISERGFADLIALHELHGFFLIEVKSAKGKLTTAQVITIRNGWPVHLIRSPEDVVQLVKRARKQRLATR